MRCICCNTPFKPSFKTGKGGKVIFEEMCSSCRSKVNISTYAKQWEHESISEKPIDLYLNEGLSR